MRISSHQEWLDLPPPMGDEFEGCEQLSSGDASILHGHITAAGGNHQRAREVMQIITGTDDFSNIHSAVIRNNVIRYRPGRRFFGVCYSDRLWMPQLREEMDRNYVVQIHDCHAFSTELVRLSRIALSRPNHSVRASGALGPVIYTRDLNTTAERDPLMGWFRKDESYARECEVRHLIDVDPPPEPFESFFVQSSVLAKMTSHVTGVELENALWPLASEI